ncbi:spore germination protein [Lihuaxuella thermophila]|uniref:Spore germination protein KA n=1 Tax=Lihuaxuella thermophila TaxID=1173111 RepID=A0A1H8EVX1_9BACL|nr:spore germination protein [Lihuaxuella thermophila]SEN23619.1 spore germination protein KA [Lihuaxuella thermophila]
MRGFFHKDNQQRKENANGLDTSLSKNIERIQEIFYHSSDLIIREIQIGKTEPIKAGIIYIEGLADLPSIHDYIMESLMLDMDETNRKQQNYFDFIKQQVLTIGDIAYISDFDSLIKAILNGGAVILLDQQAQGIHAKAKGWKDRDISEPHSQTLVRGPREGFTETFSTNTSLIRRKIKLPDLCLETYTIGRMTQTEVGIMYIKGTAGEHIVQEVRKRIRSIDMDGVLESAYIEEMIQDHSLTPFPTIYNTERPDVVAAALLEGRVAILTQGTPFVLVVPALFNQFYQSPEDYYHRADISTLIRLLRLLALFIAFLGPSLYVAITTFHQEMLPTPLPVGLAAQREGIPFPAFVEALLMETTFEILREAGIRMPRAVGQAISIVGTVVIGDAAVNAGLASPAMVIVVSITAISSFIIPSYDMSISIRILRFLIMALASSFGLFGIFVGIFALVLHLCSLSSFGVPYTAPFAPFIVSDQRDALFRFPQLGLMFRPHLIRRTKKKHSTFFNPTS